DMHKPSGDLERLMDALRDQWGIENVQADFSILSLMQPILRKGNWHVTCAIHQSHDDATPSLVHMWPGLYEGTIYGMAVD
ncbi:MAG: drug:proton antiporter, partial [Planktomarina sp.]